MNTQDASIKLLIKSPLTGHLLPIEQVPDPVFSQKMVGDGISIEPFDQILVSPVDGRIAQIHSASHAVTISTAQGIDVLIHIGIDTVNLKGKGFASKIKVGDLVKTGDILIKFDADYVATHAKSLLTQVLITNGEQISVLKPTRGQVTAGVDIILEVFNSKTTKAINSTDKTTNDISIKSGLLTILNPSGLHARPAAVLASIAKQFNSDIQIHHRSKSANAKSVVAIMGLEINHGSQLTVSAQGPDAASAVKQIVKNLNEGLGENLDDKPHFEKPKATIRELKPQIPISNNSDVIVGVPAAQGLAVGFIYQIHHHEIEVPEFAENPKEELQSLSVALGEAKMQLQALKDKLDLQSKSNQGSIFAAHQELLDDPDLVEFTRNEINQGKSAAFAWKKAYTTNADRLAALSNELLAARANDIKDIGRRVLLLLTDRAQVHQNKEYPTNAILIAENLTPSDTANLDRSKVLGFCTTTGGASSHVAILARSLGIPAIAGIDPRALNISSGSRVIIDGTKGILRLNPDLSEVENIQKIQIELDKKRQADLARTHETATTLDNHRVEVVANIGGLTDAEQAMGLGAEGVGLLRSEFLFLNRTIAPTENEQHKVYEDIATLLTTKNPLTIRTLDIGGDKPLPYLPLPTEENPFLGERGIRVSLNNPNMFREQLRAILRAAKSDQMRIMFPMVATLDEWHQAKSILEEERHKLGIPSVSVGIMIEVPAAALMADVFATEVDFFSIGTNDLTQYTLAVDRGHAKLASIADGLHPSVLRLIDMTVKAAHKNKKWVGICGGIASDIQAVPVLVGLGVDELSISVSAIPGIKAQIRNLHYADCQVLAAQALAQTTAAEVRSLINKQLQSLRRGFL